MDKTITTKLAFTVEELSKAIKSGTDYYWHLKVAYDSIMDATFGFFCEEGEKDKFYDSGRVTITIIKTNILDCYQDIRIEIRWNYFNELLGSIDYSYPLYPDREDEIHTTSSLNVLHNTDCGLYIAPIQLSCCKDVVHIITNNPQFHEIPMLDLDL